MIEHSPTWKPTEHESLCVEADEQGPAPERGVAITDILVFSARFQEAHEFITSPEGRELYREVDRLSVESLRERAQF